MFARLPFIAIVGPFACLNLLLSSAMAEDKLADAFAHEKSGQQLECRLKVIDGGTISPGKPLKLKVAFSSPEERYWTLFNPWLDAITDQPGRLAVYEKKSGRYVKDLLRLHLGISWRFPRRSDWIELPGKASLSREFEFLVADNEATVGSLDVIEPLPPGTYVVQFVANTRLLFPNPGNGDVASPEFKAAWTKGPKSQEILRSNPVEFTVEK